MNILKLNFSVFSKRRKELKTNTHKIADKSSCPKFYIIWREGRSAGFFSIITGLIGHIKIAEESGMIPIIDLENFPCIYNESSPIFGTSNAFEYYFESINESPLEHIYESQEFLLSGGGYPPNFTMSISSDMQFIDIWDRYFKLNSHSKAILNLRKEKLRIDERTLGVHFRGQEMRRFRSHPFPMKLRQAINLARREMESGNFDKIFFVSEGSNYLRRFEMEFPGLVVSSDSYRSRIVNAYKVNPRHNHFYNLGVEILTDTILLSQCGGIISGSSNVSEFAIFLNQGKFNTNIQVRNGTNSANIVLSKFYWYVLSFLPKRFGGFNNFAN